MKNFLLSVAIFLAVCIDGILISEMPGDKPIGTEIAINNKTTIPEIPVVKENTKEEKETGILVSPQEEHILVAPPATRRIVCYERWEYRPFQPLRNFVRFLHNNKPLRRLACPRSLYFQH